MPTPLPPALVASGAHLASASHLPPFRFSVLLKYGGDATGVGNLDLSIMVTTDPNEPKAANYGFGIASIVGGKVTLSIGGQNFLVNADTLPTNELAWVTFAHDGGPFITAAVFPANHGPAAEVGVNPAALSDNYLRVEADSARNPRGAPVLAMSRLSKIKIVSGLATTKIMGIHFVAGSLDGGTDVRMCPPAILTPVILGDQSARVRVPKSYSGRSAVDLVIVGHQQYDASAQFASLQADLVQAGYIVASVLGDPKGDPNSPTSKDWGSPQGLAYRRALIDWCFENFANIRNVHWLDAGGGAITALNFITTYPGLIKSFAAVCPCVDLTTAYAVAANGYGSGLTLAQEINQAYGTTLAARVSDKNPLYKDAGLQNTPMMFWSTQTDPLYPAASHGDALSSAMAAHTTTACINMLSSSGAAIAAGSVATTTTYSYTPNSAQRGGDSNLSTGTGQTSVKNVKFTSGGTNNGPVTNTGGLSSYSIPSSLHLDPLAFDNAGVLAFFAANA